MRCIRYREAGIVLLVVLLAPSLVVLPTVEALPPLGTALTNTTQVPGLPSAADMLFVNPDGSLRTVDVAYTETNSASTIVQDVQSASMQSFTWRTTRVLVDTTKGFVLPKFELRAGVNGTYARVQPRVTALYYDVFVDTSVLQQAENVSLRVTDEAVTWSIANVQSKVDSFGTGLVANVFLNRTEGLWWHTQTFVTGNASVPGALVINFTPAFGKLNTGAPVEFNKTWLNATFGITNPVVEWGNGTVVWQTLPLTSATGNFSVTAPHFSTIALHQLATGSANITVREGPGGAETTIDNADARTIGSNSETNVVLAPLTKAYTNPIYKIPVSSNANGASEVKNYIASGGSANAAATSVGSVSSVTANTYYYDNTNQFVYVGGGGVSAPSTAAFGNNWSVSNGNAAQWSGRVMTPTAGTLHTICVNPNSGSATWTYMVSYTVSASTSAVLTGTFSMVQNVLNCIDLPATLGHSIYLDGATPIFVAFGSPSNGCCIGWGIHFDNSGIGEQCYTSSNSADGTPWSAQAASIRMNINVTMDAPQQSGARSSANMTWAGKFNIQVPAFVTSGQYIMAQGLIQDVNGVPVSGFTTFMNVTNLDGSALPGTTGVGPAYNTTNGNYLGIMSTSYIRPGNYVVNIVFVDAADSVVMSRGWPIAIGNNVTQSGCTASCNSGQGPAVYSDGLLYYKFFDSRSGIGLSEDFYKFYLNVSATFDESDRLVGGKVPIVVGSTYYLQVKDYYDHVVFPPSSGSYSCTGFANSTCPLGTVTNGANAQLTISRAQTFLDVGVSLYQLKIKNTQTDPAYVTATANSKAFSTWVLPGEVVTMYVPTDTYVVQEDIYDQNLNPPAIVDYAYNYSGSPGAPYWSLVQPDTNSTGVIVDPTTDCRYLSCAGQPSSSGTPSNGVTGTGGACLDGDQSYAVYCLPAVQPGSNTGTLAFMGTLDLGRVVKATNVQLHLWDGDSRSFDGYRVEVSADPGHYGWKTLFDSSNATACAPVVGVGVVRSGPTTGLTGVGACPGGVATGYRALQALAFSPMDVRYVRVFGAGGTANTATLVTEVLVGSGASASLNVNVDQFVWIRGYDLYSVVFAINNANSQVYNQEVVVGVNINNQASGVQSQITTINAQFNNTNTYIGSQVTGMFQTINNTQSNIGTQTNLIEQNINNVNSNITNQLNSVQQTVVNQFRSDAGVDASTVVYLPEDNTFAFPQNNASGNLVLNGGFESAQGAPSATASGASGAFVQYYNAPALGLGAARAYEGNWHVRLIANGAYAGSQADGNEYVQTNTFSIVDVNAPLHASFAYWASISAGTLRADIVLLDASGAVLGTSTLGTISTGAGTNTWHKFEANVRPFDVAPLAKQAYMKIQVTGGSNANIADVLLDDLQVEPGPLADDLSFQTNYVLTNSHGRNALGQYDPSFERGVGGFVEGSGVGNLSWSCTQSSTGQCGLLVTGTVGATSTMLTTSPAVNYYGTAGASTGSLPITVSYSVYEPDATFLLGDSSLYFFSTDATSSILSNGNVVSCTGNLVAQNTWTRVVCTMAAPVATNLKSFRFAFQPVFRSNVNTTVGCAGGCRVWLDDVQIEVGDHQTTFGQTAATTGKYGGGVSFSGFEYVDSYESLSQAQVVYLRNAPRSVPGVTLAGWYNIPAAANKASTSNDQTFISWGSTYVSLGNRADPSATPIVSVGGPVGGAQLFLTRLPQDGAWHHLAVTANGSSGSVSVYLDGSVFQTGGLSGFSGQIAVGSQVWVGANNAAGVIGPCACMMDDVLVSQRVLSQTEIQRLMAHVGAGILNQINSVNQNVTNANVSINTQLNAVQAQVVNQNSNLTTQFNLVQTTLTNFNTSVTNQFNYINSNVNNTNAVIQTQVNVIGQSVLNNGVRPPVDESAIGVWSFEEQSGLTVADDSPHHDTLTLSSTGTKRVPGAFGGGVEFDGVNGFGTAPGVPSSASSNWSMSVWYYPYNANADSMLIADGSGPFYVRSANGNPTVSWPDSTNTQRQLASGVTVSPNAWHHVVATHIGTNTSVYVDGAWAAADTIRDSKVMSGGTWYFGESTGGSNKLNGVIDEVRLYDRAVTSKDVAGLFVNLNPVMMNQFNSLQQSVTNQNVGITSQLNSVQSQIVNENSNISTQFNSMATTISNVNGSITNQFTYANTIVNNTNATIQNQVNILQQTVSNNGIRPPAEGSLAAYWPFDEGIGTTAKDGSARGTDAGTLNGGATWVVGAYATALALPGTAGSNVSVSHDDRLNLNGSFSLTFFGEQTAHPTTFPVVFQKGDPTTAGKGWLVWAGNTGGLSFKRDGVDYVSPAVMVWPNVFSNVGIVYDGATNLSWYLNGTWVGANVVPAWGGVSDGGNLSIGGATPQWFAGAFDEVRVYNRALSQNEMSGIAVNLNPVVLNQFNSLNQTVSNTQSTLASQMNLVQTNIRNDLSTVQNQVNFVQTQIVNENTNITTQFNNVQVTISNVNGSITNQWNYLTALVNNTNVSIQSQVNLLAQSVINNGVRPPADGSTVGYWPMDENSGAVAHDGAAAHNDMALVQPFGATFNTSANVGASEQVDSANQLAAQSFVVSQNTTVGAQGITLYLGKTGSPTGTYTVRVSQTRASGGTTVTGSASTLPTYPALPWQVAPVAFAGFAGVPLIGNVQYFLSVEYAGGDASNRIEWAMKTPGDYPTGQASFSPTGSVWTERPTYDHAMVVNTTDAGWGAGQYGGALAFDGYDDYAVASAPQVSIGNAVTVAAWVMPGQSIGANERVISKHGSWNLYYLPNGSAMGEVVTPAGTVQAFTPIGTVPTPGASNWTFLTMTYDGATLRVYTSGALQASVVGGGTGIVDSGSAIGLGADAVDQSQKYSGGIDEARVYARPLQANEIVGLFVNLNPVVLNQFNSLQSSVANANTSIQAQANLFQNDVDNKFSNVTSQINSVTVSVNNAASNISTQVNSVWFTVNSTGSNISTQVNLIQTQIVNQNTNITTQFNVVTTSIANTESNVTNQTNAIQTHISNTESNITSQANLIQVHIANTETNLTNGLNAVNVSIVNVNSTVVSQVNLLAAQVQNTNLSILNQVNLVWAGVNTSNSNINTSFIGLRSTIDFDQNNINASFAVLQANVTFAQNNIVQNITQMNATLVAQMLGVLDAVGRNGTLTFNEAQAVLQNATVILAEMGQFSNTNISAQLGYILANETVTIQDTLNSYALLRDQLAGNFTNVASNLTSIAGNVSASIQQTIASYGLLRDQLNSNFSTVASNLSSIAGNVSVEINTTLTTYALLRDQIAGNFTGVATQLNLTSTQLLGVLGNVSTALAAVNNATFQVAASTLQSILTNLSHPGIITIPTVLSNDTTPPSSSLFVAASFNHRGEVEIQWASQDVVDVYKVDVYVRVVQSPPVDWGILAVNQFRAGGTNLTGLVEGEQVEFKSIATNVAGIREDDPGTNTSRLNYRLFTYRQPAGVEFGGFTPPTSKGDVQGGLIPKVSGKAPFLVPAPGVGVLVVGVAVALVVGGRRRRAKGSDTVASGWARP